MVAASAGGGNGPAPVLESIARSLAERRFEDLQARFTSDIRMRALLPRGPEEANGPAAVIESMRDWFGWPDSVRVETVDVEPLADRWLLAYRFAVTEGTTRSLITQQCVCDIEDGRVRAIDLVCSGFRVVSAQVAAHARRFDAGTMGCADGLAQEFRRQITAIPIGTKLEVVTGDPAAREDLPPLARMMGNTVHGTDVLEDGRVVITVERNR